MVNPTTFGTFTSFTSLLVISKYTPASTINVPKRTTARMIGNLFFSSFSFSTELSSLSSSLAVGLSITCFISFVTCGITFVSSRSFSGYSYTNLFSLSLWRAVCKSLYISLTLSYLFFGFLAVAFNTMFSTDCGIVGFCFLILGIFSFICFKAISTAVSPLNGTEPVNSSYINIPRE